MQANEAGASVVEGSAARRRGRRAKSTFTTSFESDGWL